MSVFKVLKQDHRNVEDLFAKIELAIERNNESQAWQLFEQLKRELLVHAECEHEAVYRFLREEEATRDFFYEGSEAHKLVEELLEKMEAHGRCDARWEGMLAVLKSLVETHVQEEENDIFPKMKEAFDKEELDAMEEEMLEEKASAMNGRGYAGQPPEGLRA